jgi:hypothetical protein
MNADHSNDSKVPNNKIEGNNIDSNIVVLEEFPEKESIRITASTHSK